MDYQFKDVRFISAGEKIQTLNAWKRFLKNGLPLTSFTQALYHHLIQHCSFIAHYSRHGFYEFYFADHPSQALRFLSQFDRETENHSVEYGWTHWLTDVDYSDINRAMVEVFSPYKAALYKDLKSKALHSDRAAAEILLSRHGLKAVIQTEEARVAENASAGGRILEMEPTSRLQPHIRKPSPTEDQFHLFQ